MFKTLAAGLTAAALVLLPPAPVQAQTQNEELNRTLLTLLTIGAVGLAIKNNQDRADDKKTQAPRQVHDNDLPRRFSNTPDHSNGRGHAWGRANRQAHVDLLPGRCFRRVETGRGGYQAVYAGRCLEQRYRNADRLPRQCEVRMGGRDGNRRGYDAACLADFGYRSDQRWN